MKKYFLILLLLIIPFNVKGLECDNQDMARYQKLASNINFSYDFIEANNAVTFNIIVSNLPSELYITDVSTGNIFSATTVGSSETVLYGYQPGNNYQFMITPYDQYCFESTVMSKYVNLPSYNSYYNDPVCDEAENYKLCQKWTNTGLNHDNFVKQVNEYKNSNTNKPDQDNQEEDYSDDFLNKIIVGFLDNYIIILMSIIAVCTIGIAILSKKDKFDLK